MHRVLAIALTLTNCIALMGSILVTELNSNGSRLRVLQLKIVDVFIVDLVSVSELCTDVCSVRHSST